MLSWSDAQVKAFMQASTVVRGARGLPQDFSGTFAGAQPLPGLSARPRAPPSCDGTVIPGGAARQGPGGMPRSAVGGSALVALLVALALCARGAEGKDVIDMEFCGNDDCYKILQVSSDATLGKIKKGYYKMSLQYHPDKVGHKSEKEQADAHRVFVRVAAAYEVVGDKKSRRTYDMWVRGGRKRRPGIGPIPAYYRDDHMRGDVKHTPAAFAAVIVVTIVTLLISIGVPVWMSVQAPGKAPFTPEELREARLRHLGNLA